MEFNETIENFENDHIKRKTVHIKDMIEAFASPEGANGEDLVYEVFVKLFLPVNMAMTVIEPGCVDNEFYMTRGHTHENPNPEFYFLLEGEGTLLIEQEEDWSHRKLKKGGLVVMPARYAHRTINTGTEKLKFVTVNLDDSGRTYGYDFKNRLYR